MGHLVSDRAGAPVGVKDHLDADRHYAHLSERCERAVLVSEWRATDHAPHVRMELTEDAELPSPCPYEVVGPDSKDRVLTLLERSYSGHTFHPSMLHAASFVMLTDSRRDLACAGTPSVATPASGSPRPTSSSKGTSSAPREPHAFMSS